MTSTAACPETAACQEQDRSGKDRPCAIARACQGRGRADAPVFEIHTLRVGELLLPHNGGILRDPIHAWLVTDGARSILVDSGMPDMAEVRRRLNVDGSGGGHESLREALARIGRKPEDVSHVVLTHLHFDHAWNLDLFPQACAIVQRDEVMHAIDPVPTQRIYYLREAVTGLLGRKRPSAFRLVDGDVDFLPGFRLLKTPGHTPGMQVAIVDTARGRVGLVSDLGDHYRYWYPADPRANEAPLRFLSGSFMPGPIRSEGELAYADSMRRVKDLAEIVVPAHDARIPVQLPRDWFELPPG
ncbi:N-acyl homoserine lactonase family protein [Falsiroseomonas sp. HW251]|uniref:N-acyl homoserine lactonase family protein n=1 Tax=Falsiroseomonas sp. HW251 TaxID=3390998 RepID=UPI003D323A29